MLFFVVCTAFLIVSAEIPSDLRDRFIDFVETAVTPVCPDVDGDNLVAIGDIARIIIGWRPTLSSPRDPLYDEVSDLNADGAVDISDLATLLIRYSCRRAPFSSWCPAGIPVADCRESTVCQTSRCPAHPRARCEVSGCGGRCHAVWLNGAGNEVNCFLFGCPPGILPPPCPGPACSREQCATLSPNAQFRCFEDVCGTCSAVVADCPSRCADGSQPVECFADPCDGATCPANPNARCTSSRCGSCRAIWRNEEGHRVSCDPENPCPEGQVVTCVARPCSVTTCPRFPSARCVDNYCNGCEAIFLHPTTGRRLSVEECALPPFACEEGATRNDGCASAICVNRQWEVDFRECFSRRPGVCPADLVTTCGPDGCTQDSQCPIGQKCCRGCSSQCTPAEQCSISDCAAAYRARQGPTCADGSFPSFVCRDNRCVAFCTPKCRAGDIRLDGCNTCSCVEGQWACTERACPSPRKPGMCPEAVIAIACVGDNSCSDDSGCPGDYKCCSGCCHEPQECSVERCRALSGDARCPDGSLPTFQCMESACQRICRPPGPCSDGSSPVQCFQSPCAGQVCSAFPNARCEEDYCGGCNFRFVDANGNRVNCDQVAPTLRWYQGCGDIVCQGFAGASDIPLCRGNLGDTCAVQGQVCRVPNDPCNTRRICSIRDPQPICPVSARRFKRDIERVTDDERSKLADAIFRVPLSTWKWREAKSNQNGVGFIMDELEALYPGSPAVRSGETEIDLYGLAAMQMAAIQELKRELEELKRACSKR